MAWGDQTEADSYTRRHSSTEASGSEHSGASSPISIVPTQLSPTSFAYPASLGGGSSVSDSFGSGVRDGPLHDLLPAFAASPSRSSSSGTRLPLSVGSWSTDARMTGVAESGRRVVSSPNPFAFASSSSPRSPLSGGAGFAARDRGDSDRSPTARPHAGPRQSFPPPTTALGLALALPSPKSQRRRSLNLSSSAGSPGTPFGTLVGSYEQSLLTGRMSALPSHPLPFLAAIGVLGAPDAPVRLRCPPHLAVSFEAFFYSGPEGTHSGASPYVGTIDLEAAYLAQLSASSPPTEALPSHKAKEMELPRAPKFPGYRVPRRGQVQIIVKNPNSTAIKLFLVPYDLTGLDRDGLGGKTFLRQKSYTIDAGSPSDEQHKGRLRYAVHLQFCSPPAPPGSSLRATPADSPTPQYYLHQTIRVVFASRALDSTEKLRVVAEGPHGVVLDPNRTEGAEQRFMPYKGPGAEWEMARKKAKGRERVRIARVSAGFELEPPPPPKSLACGYDDEGGRSARRNFVEDDDEDLGERQDMRPDPDNVSETAVLSSFRSSPYSPRQPALDSTPAPRKPSPSLPLPSLTSLSLSYLASPPPAAPLTFARPTSPILPRKGVSALSSSRPTSPHLFGGRKLPDPEESPPPPPVRSRTVPDAGR